MTNDVQPRPPAEPRERLAASTTPAAGPARRPSRKTSRHRVASSSLCSNFSRRRFFRIARSRNSIAAHVTVLNRRRLRMWMMIGIDTSSSPAATNAGVTKESGEDDGRYRSTSRSQDFGDSGLQEGEPAFTPPSCTPDAYSAFDASPHRWPGTPLSATSSGSPLFMRVKSMCIPRQSFCRSSVNAASCSRYALAQRPRLGQQLAHLLQPLNSVVSSNGNSISAGSRIWNAMISCFLYRRWRRPFLMLRHVVEEVGQDHDQAAVVQLLGDLVEDLAGVGLVPAAGRAAAR